MPTKNHQHPSQLQPNKKIIEMLIVFHKEMKVVNKEHQSIFDLKLPFRNYDARIAFVCFEVPCRFEVHIPVNAGKIDNDVKCLKIIGRKCHRN